MNSNPYASPVALSQPAVEEVGTADPNLQLFTSQQVLGASFLASPLAGGVLLALNQLRLGRPAEAAALALGGLLYTAAMVGVLFALPVAIPHQLSMIIALGNAFLVKLLGDAVQGEVEQAHVEAGGQIGSIVEGALVCLTSIAVLVGAVFALVTHLG